MKTDRKSLGSNLLRQWLTLGAIVAAFGVNVYANIAPPNGLTIGDISNKLFGEVQIIPANYAFAIWGIIYLGLIGLGIYQVMPAQRQNPQLERVGYLLVVASLAQIVWVFLFEYQLFGLSVVAMLGILLPLIGIYLRLGIGKERVSRKDKWFVHIPLSIYLAWISVATIVNIASTLYYWRWNGWGISPQVWTIIMLIVAAAIAATIVRNGVDIAYPLVVIWAFVAIAVRQANQPAIAGWAIALALALGILLLVNIWRGQTQKL
ncbi:tryptophan-rich sensory protein [Microcoleus sp. FACHB-831]|uniref:tryptophan-rich sensory protein n=1 Tax=Microcoleus sp. FACHB-831 TaxID=2692827 RepID=UPI001684CAA2|nr:tryptophan-rich sensory protein [Microcoleus sp. FACHB-831]MBD1923651.1 tryptophan-rich sensory protein [Microcoleus sp. FACHB-831]